MRALATVKPQICRSQLENDLKVLSGPGDDCRVKTQQEAAEGRDDGGAVEMSLHEGWLIRQAGQARKQRR